MAGEIKQKIVLEGEKEYSAQLKEANRNLKTLQSQLKAETAELGKNATAQQKAEVKAKSLQEQIKEQEKVVKTLQDALAEVREKYGDNEDAVAKWEQNLNGARTTLANMKNDLAGVGDGMQTVAADGNTAVTAANSLADSLERMSGIGGAISGSLETAFTGAVSAVKEAVAEIWGDLAELAAKSNNYVDLAGYWNTDVQTISKYAGAVRAASADLNDLNTLVTKINQVDEKKVAELTGVSSANYEDRWQYAMAVMDALSEMDTLSRNKAGFEIFGRGATKMFDMANDWATVQQSLMEFDADKGGFGLSTEELQQMSSYYDELNKIQEKWQRLKEMGEVKLVAGVSMDLMSNADAILDALLKYFNAEDEETREAALQTMEENIIAAFDRVKSAIESGLARLDELAEKLKESENPTVKAIGNILDGIVEALKWFTEDNMNNAVKAFEILAGFWIAGKGLQLASKVAEFAASLKTIQSFKTTKALTDFLQSGALNGTAGTGTGSGTPAVVPTGTGTGAGAATGAAATKFSILPNLAAMIAVWEGAKKIPLQWAEAAKAAVGKSTDADKALAEYNQENGIETLGDVEQKLLETSQEQNRKTMGFMLDTLLHPGKKTELTTAAESPEEAAERKAKEQAEYWANRPQVDVETGDYTRPHNPRIQKGTAEIVETVGADEAEKAAEKIAESLEKAIPEEQAKPESGAAGSITQEQTDAAEIVGTVGADEAGKAAEKIAESVGKAIPEEQAKPESSAAGSITQEQIDAAEKMWDALRGWGSYSDDQHEAAFDAAWQEFEEAFTGQENLCDAISDLVDQLQTEEGWENQTDLPASWWQDVVGRGNNPNQITSGDLNNMNNTLSGLGRAVQIGAANGVSGIRVYMDGQAVGRLVTPYVSEYIAAMI